MSCLIRLACNRKAHGPLSEWNLMELPKDFVIEVHFISCVVLVDNKEGGFKLGHIIRTGR